MSDSALGLVEEERQRLLLLAGQHNQAWEEALLQAFTRIRTVHAASFDKEGADLGHFLKASPSSQPVVKEPSSSPPLYVAEAASSHSTQEQEIKDDVSVTSDEDDAISVHMSSDDLNTSMRSQSPKAIKAAKTMAGLLDKQQEQSASRKTIAFVKARIDYAAAVLVLVNSMVMLLELEFEGRYVGTKVDMVSSSRWHDQKILFRTVDNTFVVIFTFEWLFRVLVERMKFLRDPANYFDTLLVIAGIFEILISFSLSEGPSSILLLRLMRVLKSLRAVRMVRSLRFFRGLRVLVKACQCFLPSLCWSMVLLSVMMTMGALLMGNLLQGFILDEEVVSLSLEDRQWLWLRYGTASRATYTLFEITFAGNWPVSARPVLEKVNYAFVFFFVLYITVVVFAVIRVISAVFLKDTLDAAQNDAEQLVVDRLRMKSQFTQKLEGIFNAIDESGNGLITEERLAMILANPRVKAYFQTMDLDVHESRVLFHLLDNGDGQVTLEEFIDGIMRCKGPARAIDQVAMHAEIKQMDVRLSRLMKLIRKMKQQNIKDRK